MDPKKTRFGLCAFRSLTLMKREIYMIHMMMV